MKTYLAPYRKAVVAKINALQSGLISKGPQTYPRVELHSGLESPTIDKDYDCRPVSIVVDIISKTSFDECAQIAKLLLDGKTVDGVEVPGLVGVNTITIDNANVATDIVSYDDMKEMTEEDCIIYRHVIRIESNISKL